MPASRIPPLLPLLLALAVLGFAAIGTALAHGPKNPPGTTEAAAGTGNPTAPETTAVWGCPMCETVRQAEPGSCPLCRMALVRMDEVADAAVPGGPLPVQPREVGHASSRPRPMMPGLPDWMFFAAAGAVLALSFVLFEVGGRRNRDATRRPRFNLLELRWLKALLRHRGFQFVVQLPMVLLLGLILAAGLFGNQDPSRNIAPILTWTLWWTWLVIVILFLGKIWCTACPWMAIADWIGRRSLWRRSQRPLGLGLRWPRRLRNIWLATGLFVLLTWLELGFCVTEKPWLTALLGLVMLAAAVGTLLVFERKAFCRYACLVGRVSGLYAMFAGSELRARDKNVCRTCETKDCFHGNERGYPCPTHQFLGGMETNTYCTLCTECVKTCPHDNVAWNLRPPAADLVETTRVRVDEGYLAVVMLSMSAFHGLTMTPAWDRLVGAIQAGTGLEWLAAFTAGMAGVLAAPLVLYYGLCRAMRWFAGDRERSTIQLFVRFAYSLLPIALFYHLAHNLQHIFYEGKKVIAIASDPFGRGLDLFGTANLPLDAVLPIDVIWTIQVALILIGHVYGILIAHRTAAKLYPTGRAAMLSQIPMLVAMMLFSFQSLWLVAQPMVMRTAM